MATPFADTPTWFNTNYYLDQKVAQMQLADPKGEWTRDKVLSDFAAHNIDNPYDHYKAFGDIESLSPNPLFNNAEYLAAKAALMGSTWTVEMVAKDIADHGLTLMEHYIQFGGKYENLNPSSEFDQNKYFDAKLDMMQTAEPDKGWTLDMVKESFANAGLSALEHYLTYGKVEGLDKYDYSVNGDPIPHPGNTKIVLTTGADVVTKDATDAAFKTTDRDDVISALVTSATKSTLNPTDVIDGGAGVDTLKVDLQSGFLDGFKTGSVKNVEKIVLENAESRTFNAKGVEKAQVYTIDGGDKGTTVIKNVDSTDTSYVLTKATGKLEVQVADATLTGKTDNVNVILSGVGTAAAAGSRVELDVKGTSTAGVVEGVALNAEGKESFVTLLQKHQTIAVKGAGDVDVAASASGGLVTFDASTATGKVAADLSKSSATLKNITGGANDDNITVGVAALSGTVFTGGDGNDTLTFVADPTATAKPTISGFEKIKLEAAVSHLNGTNITGVTEVVLGGAIVATTSELTKFTSYSEMAISVDSSGDAATTGAVSYDGTGTLNFRLVDLGADATASVQSVNSLTANKVDTLHIANADDNGVADSLTVTAITATKATSMSVDTGLGGTTTINANAGDLNAVQTLTVTGTGNFVDSGSGDALNLTEVNAEALGGTFSYTLHGNTKALTALAADDGLVIRGSASEANAVTGTAATEHITFYGGSDTNTFIAGTNGGKDFVTLGGGSYTLEASTSAAGTDLLTVSGFGSDDVFANTVASSNVVFSGADRGTGKMMCFEKNGLDLTDTSSTKTVDVAMTAFLASSGATLATTSPSYFAIDNGNDIGVYKVTFAAAIPASSAAAAGSITNGIVLMGILSGTDLSELTGANFAA